MKHLVRFLLLTLGVVIFWIGFAVAPWILFGLLLILVGFVYSLTELLDP